MRETVTIGHVEMSATTDKAVLLDLGSGDERWFPKEDRDGPIEGLEELRRGDGPGEFECPLWLARREDLE